MDQTVIQTMVKQIDALPDQNQRYQAKLLLRDTLIDLIHQGQLQHSAGAVAHISKLMHEAVHTAMIPIEHLHDVHALYAYHHNEPLEKPDDPKLKDLHIASAIFTGISATLASYHLATARNKTFFLMRDVTFSWLQFGSSVAGTILSGISLSMLGPILLAAVPGLASIKHLFSGFYSGINWLARKLSRQDTDPETTTHLGFDTLYSLGAGVFHGGMAIGGLTLSLMAFGYVTAFGALSAFMATPPGWIAFACVASVGVLLSAGHLITRFAGFVGNKLMQGAKPNSLRETIAKGLIRFSKLTNPIKKWWRKLTQKSALKARLQKLKQLAPKLDTRPLSDAIESRTPTKINTHAVLDSVAIDAKQGIDLYAKEKERELGKENTNRIKAMITQEHPPLADLSKTEQKLFACYVLQQSPYPLRSLHNLQFHGYLPDLFTSRFAHHGDYEKAHQRMLFDILHKTPAKDLFTELKHIANGELKRTDDLAEKAVLRKIATADNITAILTLCDSQAIQARMSDQDSPVAAVLRYTKAMLLSHKMEQSTTQEKKNKRPATSVPHEHHRSKQAKIPSTQQLSKSIPPQTPQCRHAKALQQKLLTLLEAQQLSTDQINAAKNHINDAVIAVNRLSKLEAQDAEKDNALIHKVQHDFHTSIEQLAELLPSIESEVHSHRVEVINAAPVLARHDLRANVTTAEKTTQSEALKNSDENSNRNGDGDTEQDSQGHKPI